MNNIVDTNGDTSPSYTLYLSSNDKTSGDHNNATFNINWSGFLPEEYDQFKVRYSFVTTTGAYVDSTTSTFDSCQIIANFQGQSLSYGSSSNAPTTILGYAQRDYPATYNSFSAYFYQFPQKTISRPNQNVLNIQIFNANKQDNKFNQLLLNTDTAGTLLTDMTPWYMVLEFIPVVNSYRKLKYHA